MLVVGESAIQPLDSHLSPTDDDELLDEATSRANEVQGASVLQRLIEQVAALRGLLPGAVAAPSASPSTSSGQAGGAGSTGTGTDPSPASSPDGILPTGVLPSSILPPLPLPTTLPGLPLPAGLPQTAPSIVSSGGVPFGTGRRRNRIVQQGHR